jgi:hypothetical protein
LREAREGGVRNAQGPRFEVPIKGGRVDVLIPDDNDMISAIKAQGW